MDARARHVALRTSGLLDSPPEPQFDRLTRMAQRLLAAPVALVSLVDEDRQFFKSAQGLPEPWRSRRETPLSHSFCQYVVRDRRPLVIADARRHPLVRTNLAIRDLGVSGYLGVPLCAPGQVTIGTVCVITTQPRAWSSDEIELMEDLAAIVAAEIASRHAASHDQLTGLANRRGFLDAMSDALAACHASAVEISLVMLDLDRFKPINDGLGHAAGDMVLEAVAKRLITIAGHQRCVARLGGDEFAILLHSGLPADAGPRLAEEIRLSVAAPMVIEGHQLSVGVSVGIARASASTATTASLLQAADRALYIAKAHNQSCR